MKTTKEEETKFHKKEINLLVINANTHNYYKLFEGAKVEGIPVRVEQASFEDITLSSYPGTSRASYGVVVELHPKKSEKPYPNTFQGRRRTILPDLVLIRNIIRGTKEHDYRNVVYGLSHSNMPCLNSLQSVLNSLERPVVFGILRKCQGLLGKENFPLIEQNYHSYGDDLNFTPGFPCVCKIAHTHAGYGKMKVDKTEVLKDLKSVVQLDQHYSTTEPFIVCDYELRLQKIGNKYRAMKKTLSGASWKSNSLGGSFLEDYKIKKKHIVWLDTVAKVSEMDILALDVLVDFKGKEYIIELNDCAIGFCERHEEEDLQCIKELTLQKIKSEVLKKPVKIEKLEYLNEDISQTAAFISAAMESEKVKKRMEQKIKKLEEKVKFVMDANKKAKILVQNSSTTLKQDILIGIVCVLFSVFVVLLVFKYTIGFK